MTPPSLTASRDVQPGSSRAGRRRRWTSALLVLAAVVAIVMLGRRLSDALPAFAGWIDGLGIWGPVLFVLGYAVACIAVVPAALLTLAAGVIFGVGSGIALVLAGATLGATGSFLIARYVARERVEQWVARDDRLATLDRLVATDGRRLVFLMRLSPVFPFSALNYALGLTPLTLRDFLIAMTGIVPGTVLYVYSGSVAGAVVGAAAGQSAERGVADYALLVLGLAATLAVAVLITRAARRALKGADATPDAGSNA
jgi:uncharacterized membrane protein YdjX (TVP38/TMEM64 family)